MIRQRAGADRRAQPDRRAVHSTARRARRPPPCHARLSSAPWLAAEGNHQMLQVSGQGEQSMSGWNISGSPSAGGARRRSARALAREPEARVLQRPEGRASARGVPGCQDAPGRLPGARRKCGLQRAPVAARRRGVAVVHKTREVDRVERDGPEPSLVHLAGDLWASGAAGGSVGGWLGRQQRWCVLRRRQRWWVLDPLLHSRERAGCPRRCGART